MQLVAIVNQKRWRAACSVLLDPVGQRLRRRRGDSTSPMRTIVGVVGDVLDTERTGRPEPEIDAPFAVQAPVLDDVPRREGCPANPYQPRGTWSACVAGESCIWPAR